MKPKRKAILFPTKPKATQRRNSLLRIKDELRRRSVRVVLSPLPHFSPFKAAGKSSAKYSPRTSIVLVDRRSLTHDGTKSKQTDEQTEKIRIQVITPKFKKQRKNSKRKTEAEKLREESSKECTNDGNIFGTRRALRSRLILTPKSPVVRVKRTAQRSMKSRKISLTSLNKFLSRDVVIELEKTTHSEESPEKVSPDSEVPESDVHVDENDTDADFVQKPIPPERDVRIILEKLPPTITPASELENEEGVSSASSSPSKRNASCLEPPLYKRESSKVFKSSEDVPLREVRILLDKLPDTVFVPAIETLRLNETDTTPVDMEDIDEGVKVLSFESPKTLTDDVDNQSAEKSCEIPLTPTIETVPEQPYSPVTPIAVSESQATPVTSPASAAAHNVETGSKKTPRSLDIPLRRVTIVKSKFTKMNRALESSPEVTPVRIRQTSTYLFSPSIKLKTAKSNEATTLASDNTSCLEPSIMDLMSSASSSSAVENDASSETSTISESLQSHTTSIAPPPSSKIASTTLKSRSSSDAANILRRIKPISSNYPGTKPILVPKSPSVSSKLSSDAGNLSKSSNKIKSVLVKKIPKTSAAWTLKKNESVQMPSVESTPSSQTTPLCTEISSPLSRGQLLTAKSLASSPNPMKMILIKSPSHVTHSTKSNATTNTSGKTPTKSPLNRGRLLTEQSLAASPKHTNSDSYGSAVPILQRTRSHLCSGSKERQNVSYKQKWASAGDLLKISSKEKDGKTDTKTDSTDLSTMITPLPATGVFSNAKTCASILSTLKSTDRNKSKSAPEKLPQWSVGEVGRSVNVTPKTSQNLGKISTSSVKLGSRSQSDLSEKLAEVRIDSRTTKPPSQASKVKFHIPKVKPGDSFNFKKPMAPPSSLARSGFTPSPPSKSSLVGSVLDKSTYVSSSYSAPRYPRQLPVKPSQTSHPNTSSAKPFISRSQHSARPPYVSSSQSASARPPHSSSYRSSTIKPPYTASSQFLFTKPPPISNFYSDPNVRSLTKANDPRLHATKVSTSTKPNDSPLHPSITKPSHSPNTQLPFTKPSTSTYHPSSTETHSIPPYQPPPSKSQTPSTTPAVPKPHLPIKSVTDYKPLTVKTSSASSNKSKSRPFKTAYMSCRSSNNDSFSKCLPSGPQYSPSYSKYLQNGFSYLPKAQYKLPEAPKSKPTSPGTNEVLRWSTTKPWNVNKPTASPPVGPSNSLTSSVLSSDPAYSPLCPQFDAQAATYLQSQ